MDDILYINIRNTYIKCKAPELALADLEEYWENLKDAYYDDLPSNINKVLTNSLNLYVKDYCYKHDLSCWYLEYKKNVNLKT